MESIAGVEGIRMEWTQLWRGYVRACVRVCVNFGGAE